MTRHILTVVGYIVATFGAQATSHFLLFSDHYAEVSHIKKEPVLALGVVSMLIQGSILSFMFAQSKFVSQSIFDAVKVSWAFGLFLVSYIGLAEAAKYTVPSASSWIGVEFLVGFIQFTCAGVFMGLAHSPKVK